ncbi:protein YkfO [Escherichia coli str. K-12 substr. MG1655]|uniref:Protein YkfO n=1 Tax=Escherichia coli (strain K12) TaxID=83333 RepID=YKFO_ECOLI|nr:protein YkfO [Escherichia coli str. K-12 substr. MG1655] [Escherichia coli]YP_010283908.1 protein YkfO [Escherichia coli str. K-12 substr. MG1655]P0DUW0.1 RecName: Full=Protein YkfO [Escherichia coli K-12]UMR55111.1 protein YkfO [Escherichia coli str. K-12 substr. MG1655]
MSTTYQCIVR